MKKFTRNHYLLIVTVLVALGLTVMLSSPKPKPSTAPSTVRVATIMVEDNHFTPATLIVKQGTRVTWRISGDDEDTYQIASNPAPFDHPSGFDSPAFHGGGTYTYVFTHTGTYGYHNQLIPTGGGQITVVE